MKDLNVSYGSAGAIMTVKWSESSKEFGIVSTTKETTLSLSCFGVDISWILHLILEATFQNRYWQTEWSSEDKEKKPNTSPANKSNQTKPKKTRTLDQGDVGIDFWGKIKEESMYSLTQQWKGARRINTLQIANGLKY